MKASKNLNALFAKNPVFQFSRKAARGSAKMISDTRSPIAVSMGLDQELTFPSDQAHYERVQKHRTHLNMMRFDIQQRSIL